MNLTNDLTGDGYHFLLAVVSINRQLYISQQSYIIEIPILLRIRNN